MMLDSLSQTVIFCLPIYREQYPQSTNLLYPRRIFLIIIIEESNMFYSPTKEFVRFSTYRTAEIKALKQRIQKEKVTPEEITATQMRLEKLKGQYELLQQENHGELKDVLQSSEAAIADLLQEKAVKQKEIIEKGKQIAELESIKQELQEKGCLIEEQLRGEVLQKQHLGEVKTKYEENILLLDKQFDSIAREIGKQQGIQDDIRTAEADLAKKWETHRGQVEECRKEKQDLLRRIFDEKQAIAQQQKQWELCEKEIERHQVLKEKGRVTDELLRFKIDALVACKARQGETAWMLSEQKQTGQGLSELLSAICEETSKLERQQLSCQKQIKEILIKLTEEESIKCKLQEKIAVIKSNLRLLKEKNENLKNKMNSIFKNDCELIKTISNKKVYPNCKPELLEIVKKSAVQPLATKENIVLQVDKTEKIEAVLSPRGAFVANRIF